MSPTFFNHKGLSYLRFLTNRLVDAEVAGAMLENVDLEIILDIQAVMIIGMQMIENGMELSCQDPAVVYEERRRAIPVFNDREEEIRYLLQPEYKEYLQAGMQALTLN